MLDSNDISVHGHNHILGVHEEQRCAFSSQLNLYLIMEGLKWGSKKGKNGWTIINKTNSFLFVNVSKS